MSAAGGISLEELKCAVTLPKENLHLAAYELGNGQVELAIAVEICRNNINVPHPGRAKVSPSQRNRRHGCVNREENSPGRTPAGLGVDDGNRSGARFGNVCGGDGCGQPALVDKMRGPCSAVPVND